MQIVALGALSPINSPDNDNEFFDENTLAPTLRHIAKSYGGRVELDELQVAECIIQIREHFGEFGIEELTQSYRLWKAGKFDAPEGIAYGGKFDAGNLSSVLKAYKVYRRKVLKAYKETAARLHAEAYEKENAERLRVEYAKGLFEEIKTAAETKKYKTYKDVPIKWYEHAVKYGILTVTEEEYNQYIKRAGNIRAALEEEPAEPRRFQFEKVFGPYSAETIAGQLIVFEILLTHKRWNNGN